MGPTFRRIELTSPEPLEFSRDPTYLVLTSQRDLKDALGVTSLPVPVEWSREFVVVAQRGECPTGGYTVAIDGLSLRTPGQLTVTVSQTDPSPSDFVTMVITYPRAAAAVSRAGLEGVTRVVFADRRGRTLETVEVTL